MSGEIESRTDEAGGRGSWESRRTGFVLIGMALATLTAFRTVLIAPFGWVDPAEFEYWFFIPTRDSGALSILVASWFLWNRRARFASTPAAPIGWPHWAGAVVVTLLFVWVVWMRVQAQLIPLVCLTMAAMGAAWGGRAGLRLIAMPSAALLLALPPPSPIQAEIIWRLQGLTAAGADLVLTLAGYSIELEGTDLRFGGHAFVIIEACSGWRGIQVLSLMGLLATELRGLSFRRGIWVVAAAMPLGIVLNIIRACLVMLTNEEMDTALFESHTPQGVAVLMLGSLVLYGFAALLERREVRVDATRQRETSAWIATPRNSFRRWAVFGLTFPIALSLISVLFPVLRDPLQRPRIQLFNFPEELGPWRGTPLDVDYFFPYSTPANRQLHIDYRDPDAKGGGDLVDLFVAREIPTSSGLDRMPDVKLLHPASDWTLDSRQRARVWQLKIDAEKAFLHREAGSKWTYVIAWRPHDGGLLQESLRSLLGLYDCDRSNSDCARIVIRIAVPIVHPDDAGRDRAVRTANRFIDDFVLPLKILEFP